MATCGSGVMIGLIVIIIVVRHSIIRRVLCQAIAVCCVGEDCVMMRGVAKCRTETSTFRANVTATMAVCALP